VNLISDRVYVWLIVWTILALAVAVDPPFGFGGLSIVASVVGGALIGLLVSRYYSQRASEELRREAGELRREAGELRRHINVLIAYFQVLELDPRIDVDPDKVTLRGSAAASPRSSASASGTLQHLRNQDKDAEDAGES
jgi:hypothetical protein